MSDTVDLGALDALAAQIGEAETLEVVRLFVQAAPQRDAALAVSQPDQVARAAHTVRSGARLVGAAALAESTGRLQQSAEAGAADWQQQRDRLREQLAAVVHELEGWLTTRG
ncbi:Hpt domain-containing protein [Nocardioides sp.]|uniref:Hpt domain-containing protein n=1 Tax=Nocardioides sp. TaxID=35761 RepID=UPI00351269C7